MNDMNDNKTWRVTIQLTVVATEDPLDDNSFSNHMYQLVLDDYDMSSSVEGAILIGAEAIELGVRTEPTRPYTLKTEPVPVVVATRTSGKRPCRTRRVSVIPGVPQVEYLYFSSDYRYWSKQIGVGTVSTSETRKCVWLTRDEAAQVNVKVMEQRAGQEARRTTKGGE